MLKGNLAQWWEGSSTITGEPQREQRPPPPPIQRVQEEDSAKEEIFGHLLNRPHDNPRYSELYVGRVGRKKNDLASFNDGSALALDNVDKSPKTSPHFMRVGSSDYEDAQETLVGLGMRPPQPNAQQASARLQPGPSEFGRRFLKDIAPFNDGSTLMMQAAYRDHNARARADDQAYQLVNCSGLSVEAVPKTVHDDKQAQILSSASCSAGAWERLSGQSDKKPFALSGEAVAQAGTSDARRHMTDVTKIGEDVRTPYQRDKDAERRYIEAPSDKNHSNWRLGDTRPFRVDFSEARPHENLFNPNQGAWRIGDELPYRIDHSLPNTMDRAKALATAGMEAPYAGASINGRRYTDMHFYHKPEFLDARRRALQYAPAEPVGAAGKEFMFGPLANGPPMSTTDITVRPGLTWAEMERRGKILHKSQSETSLRPAGLR